MDIQSKNFIEILSSYLKNKKPMLLEPDWQQIYKLANLHNLGGVVYSIIKDKNICNDEDVEKRLKKAFMGTVKISAMQEFAVSQVIDILNQNKIRHILFKGCVLRNYYPIKELRTMGDIDIIIDTENRDKVHELMLNSGFEFDELASKLTVRNYAKYGVYFEIHTKIVYKNLFEDINAVEYFEDNFKYAKNVDKFTYEFNYEHHLVYMLMHIAIHFNSSGCGVRMLLDVAVFVNKFNKNINWEYINDNLDLLGLLDFSKNIFTLCNEWFECNIPLANNNLSKSDMDTIANYILAGGVFGEKDRNLDAIRINEGNSSLFERIRNLLRLIFPNYESIKSRYVWFEGTPKWLLPVGWIRLWWFRVITNKENSFKRIKSALVSNNDATEHTKLMNIIGLRKNK